MMIPEFGDHLKSFRKSKIPNFLSWTALKLRILLFGIQQFSLSLYCNHVFPNNKNNVQNAIDVQKTL